MRKPARSKGLNLLPVLRAGFYIATDFVSVVTDMGANGEIPVEEGVKTSISLATLPADGYTGKLIHLGEELPW